MALVIFIVVLGVLVLVHEWGHFFAARKFGIRVDEFGFGFPPRVFGKKFGETLYSINLFPLGGFVRIFGEQGEGEGDRQSFASHPVWRRVIIIVSGVFMNVVLAWVLFSAGHIIGIPAVADGESGIPNSKVTIIGVAPGSPAEEAKLAFGSVVLRISSGNESIEPKTSAELIAFVNAHRGETMLLQILPSAAGNEPPKEIFIESRREPPAGQGPLGIALADIGIVKTSWYLAPWEGLKSLWFSVRATGEAFAGLFRSAVVQGEIPEGVSGPLGLFVLTGQAERLGFSYFLQFMALLSINLAILNIIPFPALDGGRLLFLAIEKIRGRPVRISYERATHAVGFVLLLALILVISYRDLHRFFL
ncbi:MAG: site-2 protease family protein [Candidatus Sungbacteria bacterium]|uniref:Site-2 protease family protein n=1 Tax=Candidatus Sungiibacteriota bacterium TaxID=2750080 RepID=A0A931SBV1_9BACT|nr:site-2 protease family protein [Candidatus Sungbacteria bacterium]